MYDRPVYIRFGCMATYYRNGIYDVLPVQVWKCYCIIKEFQAVYFCLFCNTDYLFCLGYISYSYFELLFLVTHLA